LASQYGVNIQSPLQLLGNTSLLAIFSQLTLDISNNSLILQDLSLNSLFDLFTVVDIQVLLNTMTGDILNGTLSGPPYYVSIQSPLQLLGNLSFLQIFGMLQTDVSNNPSLLNDLSLNTLFDMFAVVDFQTLFTQISVDISNGVLSAPPYYVNIQSPLQLLGDISMSYVVSEIIADIMLQPESPPGPVAQ